ncbi:terpene cyclase/mutase family protein [Verrucomicrobiales bacterium]|nr:terpene cyclase/mutase family protein [Verrucomicrobiales bacterium]
MKTLVLIAALAASTTISTAAPDLSLKLEVERAIKNGTAWLATQQKPGGNWSDEDTPAISAMAVTAIMADPNRDGSLTPETEKAYKFLLSKRQSDGGIYGEGLAVYNTALSVMALLEHPQDEETEKALSQARRFLISQQSDFDKAGVTDSPFDGGIGYGGTYTHSDLSNTRFALEALHYSKKQFTEGDPETPDLDWDAAIAFVSRCQNLTSHNDQDWASDDPDNKGGFVYFPGATKAGNQELEDGKTALRSYGSISYAGLLSLVYADLKPSDPRITAVREWLAANYTVEENPGMETQGLFYYYHTMAKALRTLGEDTITLKDGKTADWRKDLALKLFDLQSSDGSWTNTQSARWMESDPVLATNYALLALTHIHRAL